MPGPILPPGLSPADFADALGAFGKIVGAQNVFTGDQLASYRDPYSIEDDDAHAASAAIAPASAEEVQAIIRLANQHKVPLWPLS